MSKNTEIARSYPASYKPLSNLAPYHIYNGSLALASTTPTVGFSTTLYTGNGSTQSITTGVDMATQWGNDVSETFGGLVWQKYRSAVGDNTLIDSVRGTGKYISSNTTAIQGTDNNSLTSFNNNGFSIGASWSANGVTAVSWNFQTTHRRTGTTNHGQAYTEHYNPFTGFTIIQYTGSGIAGHEIPHSLGRKLDFVNVKSTSTAYNWKGTALGNTSSSFTLNINETPLTNRPYFKNFTESYTIIDASNCADDQVNTSGQTFILYGWANSYFDEANTLIGNYEIGVYQGTGASGNKVTTKGKPAWAMVKRLDSTGDWMIRDNQRNEKFLYPDLAIAEDTATGLITFNSDGFTNNTAHVWNTSGGQYLYMVVYDNNSGSGKSYYPKPSDSPVINLNATVPFANGIDGNGTKLSILSKNESVTGVSLSAGKNYVYSLSDGTYGRSSFAPCYGYVPTRSKAGETPDFFNLNYNKWYSTSGGSELVTNGDGSSTSGWTAVNSTISLSSQQIRVTNNATNGYIYQSLTTTVGTKYRLKASIYQVSAYARVEVVDASSNILYSLQTASGGLTPIDIYFIAQSATTTIKLYAVGTANGDYAQYDNISCFEATPTINTAITTRNYLDAVVYGDGTGNAEYIEQLPKTQYFDEVKANDYRGRNACTAWVNFDGTTTPPTIRDSYNVVSVVRTAPGTYDVYFKTPMDNANYTISGIGPTISGTNGATIQLVGTSPTATSKVTIGTQTNNIMTNQSNMHLQVFGGKQ